MYGYKYVNIQHQNVNATVSITIYASGKKIQNTTNFVAQLSHSCVLLTTKWPWPKLSYLLFFPQRTPCMTLVRSGKRGNEGGGRCGKKKSKPEATAAKRKSWELFFFGGRNIPPPFSESLWELFLDMCVELRKQEVYAEVQNNPREKDVIKKNL